MEFLVRCASIIQIFQNWTEVEQLCESERWKYSANYPTICWDCFENCRRIVENGWEYSAIDQIVAWSCRIAFLELVSLKKGKHGMGLNIVKHGYLEKVIVTNNYIQTNNTSAKLVNRRIANIYSSNCWNFSTFLLLRQS